jgi:HK97 gp10 family phage protein
MADDFAAAMAELNSITVALETDAREVGPKARMVVAKAAAEVERIGKLFAPVDTGTLRSSISRDMTGSNAYVARAEIGPTVEYAPYVEWGTERMAPRAFMGPALDIVGPTFTEAMGSIADPTGTS